MKFRVLGPVAVSEGGTDFVVGGPKQRAVLALLIVNAGRSVSTGTLIDGVYGDSPPQGARRSIQTYISNLRGELGEIVHSTSDGYELGIGPGQVDAAMFEAAVANATEMGPVEASAILRDALAMWRGHAYSDVDAGEIVDAEIRRLSELRVRALEARIDADLDAGYHRELIAELESLTTEYPLREHFTEQQMIALYRSGRQAEALRVYERKRNYLIDEMGLDPSSELRTLEQRILEQDPSLAFDTGPMVRMASIVAGDVADPTAISALDPTIREEMTQSQADAFEEAVVAGGGDVFAHRGTAMYAWFGAIEDAVSATASAQRALSEVGYPMRMAVAIGEVQVSDGTSVQGPPLTRAAQLVATGHGGQVLLSSEANMALVESGDAGWVVRALGQHDIDGSGRNLAVYQLVVDGLPRDFAALRTGSAPAPLPVDVRGLPGYELREQVGSGAFGVVHRAYQPSVGREVAVKIIRPEFANDPDFIRHFEVEAQLVARLEHPHIVPLHDYWRSPDGAYLVMRWLRGGSLSERVHAHAFTLAEAEALVEQIAPALAFAHRHGVVHRDLKSSNILLDEDGEAYLSDFGIARLESAGSVGSPALDVRDLAAVVLSILDRAAIPDSLSAFLERAVGVDSPLENVTDFVEAWNTLVGAPSDVNHAGTYTPARNPYKGLQAFGELDAADFHGREDEVDDIVDTLANRQLVAVVGPSGIGKSSVVRAGLIPALRDGRIEGSDDWLITDMLPGPYPFDELASALLRVVTVAPPNLDADLRRDQRGLVRSVSRYAPSGQTVLLVIDQFEELFTLAPPDERNAFLEMLAATVADSRSNVRIVLTMRADFFDRPLRFSDLGEALRDGTVPISAPSDDALLRIITVPAADAGVLFEPGLVGRISADVKDEPGALPLLEFALTALFDSRSSDIMVIDDYVATGGVLGALGRRAESIHVELDPSTQAAARQIFLRLVRVSEAGRDTRRRVKLSELEMLELGQPVLFAVLRAFGDYRLLTFDRDPSSRIPTIEVAHEAIFSEWSRLATWIDDRREDLLLHGRLAVAVSDWEASDRSESFLLSGGRLVQHETWTVHTDLGLSSAETALLNASRLAANRKARARRRNRSIVMASFAIVAVIAIGLAISAIAASGEAGRQRDEATRQTDIAEQNLAASLTNEKLAASSRAKAEREAEAADEQAQIANAQALIAKAAAAVDADPELALLLATSGAGLLPNDPGAFSVLRETLGQARTLMKFDWPFGKIGQLDGGLSPDGTMMVVGSSPGDTVVMLDAESGIERWRFEPDVGNAASAVTTAEFVFDGSKVVVGVGIGGVDPALADVDPPGSLGLYLLDSATGEVEAKFDLGLCGGVLSKFGSADEYALVHVVSPGYIEQQQCGVGNVERSADHDVLRVDLRTGDTYRILEEANWQVEGWGVAIRHDGGAALRGRGSAEEMEIVDLESGRVVVSYPLTPGGADALSPDGRFVANGGSSSDNERAIYVRDASSGEIVSTLEGHNGGTRTTRFAADSSLLLTGGEDGIVKVWDPVTGREVDRFAGLGATVTEISVTADGSRIAAFTSNGTALVLSRQPADFSDESYEVCGQPGGFYTTAGLKVAADRLLVHAICGDGEPNNHLMDLASGELLWQDEWLTGQIIALSRDGRYVAGQSSWIDPETDEYVNGTVVVHDTQTGTLVEMEGLCEWTFDSTDSDECSGPPGPYWVYPWETEISPDGSMVGVATRDGGPGHVWDTASGASLARFQADSIEFSPDSSLVVSASWDKAVLEVRSTADFSVIASIPIDGEYGLGMHRFSPDGTQIVSARLAAYGPGGIVYHDALTLEEIDRVSHPEGIRDLEVSSDGSLLATAGETGVVDIWDFVTHAHLQRIPIAKGSKVQAVQFIDDDQRLLVSTPDGPVVVVPLDFAEVLDSARSRISRGFTDLECETYFAGKACPSLADLKNGV